MVQSPQMFYPALARRVLSADSCHRAPYVHTSVSVTEDA